MLYEVSTSIFGTVLLLIYLTGRPVQKVAFLSHGNLHVYVQNIGHWPELDPNQHFLGEITPFPSMGVTHIQSVFVQRCSWDFHCDICQVTENWFEHKVHIFALACFSMDYSHIFQGLYLVESPLGHI